MYVAISVRLPKEYVSLRYIIADKNFHDIVGVDEEVVNVVEGAADAVENQADAGRDATFTDRLKMAGTDSSFINLYGIH